MPLSPPGDHTFGRSAHGKTVYSMAKLRAFLRDNSILVLAALCAAGSMVLVPPDGEYIDYVNWQVLGILFCLMAAVDGLGRCGVFRRLSGILLRRLAGQRRLALGLVWLCFFASALVTNDVALLTFVPFTIGLWGTGRTLAPVVVMETVAANLGSLLTPMGNPQNLFLYARYGLDAGAFFSVTAPLWAVCLLCTTVLTLLLVRDGALPAEAEAAGEAPPQPPRRLLLLHGLLFLAGLLAVMKALDWRLVLGITVLALLLLDRRGFRGADYGLLASFVCFFVLVGNLARLPAVSGLVSRLLEGRVMTVSALLSQIISNVPAAAMLASFTEDWQGLLLGVNIGGLGTLIASMASLISYRQYCLSGAPGRGRYLAVFSGINFGLLALLLAGAAILRGL